MKIAMKIGAGLLLSLVLVIGNSSFLKASAANPVALPTASTISIDGRNYQFEAYNINDFNYFKLRDLAYVFTGTSKPFSVGWDEEASAITLTRSEQYVPAGGELSLNPRAPSKEANPTSHKLLIDGAFITCVAYNIDGLNYFKLRDIGESIDFSIAWDEARNLVSIDTSCGYDKAPDQADLALAAPASAQAPSPTKTLAGIDLGDSVSDADAVLGSPYKVISGSLEYRFYGPNSQFAMVGADKGKVLYVYSNYGFTGDVSMYADKNANNATYACDVGIRASESDVAIVEDIIFETSNAFRGFNGLPALSRSDQLQRAARLHSEDQVLNGYFSHASLDGKTMVERSAAQGYVNWSRIGENIALQYSPVGVSFVDSWINSSGHRNNILGEEYNDFGVGFANGSSCVATQLFASRY
jgi:uncharacterized protein YkwD